MSDVELCLQRLERMMEISRELASTTSLDHLLLKIAEAAVELTNSETAGILLERAGELRFVAAHQLADQLFDIPVPIDASIAGVAFTSGQPVMVPDVQVDPRYYPEVERAIGYKARSLLAVPLEFKDRRIGVLEVENKGEPRDRFGPQDVKTLTVLASQATVAIENARLVGALQEARDLAAALRQASAALGSTLNFDEVLDRILEQMSHVVRYDAANVMLIEEEGVARVYRGRGYEQFGTADTLTNTQLNVVGVPGLYHMLTTGEPLVVADVECDEDWVVSRPEHTWIASYLGVPIRVRDLVVGFLNVLSVTPNSFDQADAEQLQGFADHAAIAIENARLYRQAREELAERVRAQNQVQQHQDHLEEVVQERTADLQMMAEEAHQLNELLVQENLERKQAEETLRHYALALETRNEELDAFAQTVAHDLKGPLGLLIGYGKLLTEQEVRLQEETMQRYVQAILKTSSKMATIVDELLLLASVRKVDEVALEPLDMASIVSSAQERLAATLAEVPATIVLPQEWPQALGYEPWVEEVWYNYIDNAIAYGGRPGEGIPPRMELGAYLLPREPVPGDAEGGSGGGQVRFWVRDNGPGLAQEEQDKLFAEFTRLHQARSEGHGLGLSIVRRIVEKLGGQVGVESASGQGSLFYFTLPAVPGTGEAAQPAGPQLGAATAGRDCLQDRLRPAGDRGEAAGRVWQADLAPAALAALPADLLSRLEQATVRLDVAWVDALIDEVRLRDGALADAMARLAQEYDYHRILTAIQKAGRDAGG